MDVPHCLGTQPFRLTFGLNSVYSAFGQQLFVELLQFQSGQLAQRDFSDVRLDVVVDVASVGLVGGGPHLDFGVILKPNVHPLADGILRCLERVYFRIFLDRLFQLCFYLRLGLAQDVFVDRFAGFRVPPGGVAAFPATIAAFSDITFTVRSALCHSYRLHSATQHTTASVQ